MATIVLRGLGTQLTGTFATIDRGGGVGKPGSTHAVFTSCTTLAGDAISLSSTANTFADPITATTMRIPLDRIESVS